MSYRYTLRRPQHQLLFDLAQLSPGSVFYVFPYYVTAAKLHQDVPDLVKDTWLLDVAQMPTAALFGAAATKTIRCDGGLAVVNPEYEMRPLREMSPPRGVSASRFALWYSRFREVAGHVADQTTRRRDPWLARGLRIVIALPET